MPASILNEKDGTLNIQLLGLKLSEVQSQLNTADAWDKEQEENRKQKNALELEDVKHLNKTPTTIQFGDKDARYSPKKGGGFKKEETTSNKLLVEKEKNKSGGSGGEKALPYTKQIGKLAKELFDGKFDQNKEYILYNTEDKRTAERIAQVATKEWEDAGRPVNIQAIINRVGKRYGIIVGNQVKKTERAESKIPEGTKAKDKKGNLLVMGKNGWAKYKK
jgi:hypothetical protein